MSTKPYTIAKIRAAGAHDVLQHGASWKEADAWLRQDIMPAAEKRGEEAIYVPPFDHPDIWQGHSTLVAEMEKQFGNEGAPDVIVCSVGGGGLFNGVMEGVEKAGWKDTTVLAVETEGAASLGESVKAGTHITLPGITSQATTLGAVRVSDRTWELASTSKQAKSVILTDAEAAMGSWRFADDERILVELSCGVNLALCYGGRLQKALGRPIRAEDKVVIVVCGGSGVSVDMINTWKQEFGHLNDDISSGEQAVVPSATS